MDFRRNILIIGLAIVSYLLVLAWNEDYGQLPPSTPATVTATADDESLETGRAQQDSTEFTAPGSSADVVAVTEKAPLKNSSKVITVKTDVLDLAIDLYGGNIVSANLPDYKLTLTSNLPLPLLQRSSDRYYVVESGLFGKDGFDSSRNGPTPEYTADTALYQLADGQDELQVVLTYQRNEVTVIKRFRFQRDNYLIEVEFEIVNQSSAPWQANLSGKIVRDRSLDPSSQTSMGMQSFLGMVLSTPREPYEKFDFDDLLEKNIEAQVEGGWIAFIQHYFLSAWIPDAQTTHSYQSRIRDGRYMMGFISPEFTVAPGSTATQAAKLYVGPKILDRLKDAAPNLDLTVDYGILFFIAKPLFWLLDFLHGIIGNWGIAIILVTVIVKALFFNLSATSYRSMANMRRVAPKLQALKEQYGDDRQKMSAAMMELYRKENISIFGGCLPILVQMPVFIALYWVLLESVQLRHAPFFFWIADLSVKDPYFILPIIMGASMFIQMQLNPTPPDPMQAKVMKIMPIMMTVFFLWFPSGLVLYWVVNNILSIIQQWVITRQIEGVANGKA
jgi:YidC/Oxa1 family membrane protein insertase